MAKRAERLRKNREPSDKRGGNCYDVEGDECPPESKIAGEGGHGHENETYSVSPLIFRSFYRSGDDSPRHGEFAGMSAQLLLATTCFSSRTRSFTRSPFLEVATQSSTMSSMMTSTTLSSEALTAETWCTISGYALSSTSILRIERTCPSIRASL